MNRKNDNLSEETPTKRKKRFNIFNPFGNSYKTIKTDEEYRKKTIKFGLLSILFSLLCVGLVYPCVWLGVHGIIFSVTTFMGIFTYFFAVGNIFFFGLSLASFIVPLYLWVHGIILVVWQFSLNRRFISWLALLVWLASAFAILWLLSLSMDLIVNPMLNGGTEIVCRVGKCLFDLKTV